MLSIIVATHNAAETIEQTIAAVKLGMSSIPEAELIIVDRGSIDMTCRLAYRLGADIVNGPADKTQLMALGAASTAQNWLLFLIQGSVLDSEWANSCRNFIQISELEGAQRAGYFGLTTGALNRPVLSGELPSDANGLLIARKFYQELAACADRISETGDNQLLTALGRSRLVELPASIRHVTVLSQEKPSFETQPPKTLLPDWLNRDWPRRALIRAQQMMRVK